ncbi:flagellar protein FlgN [Microvirga terricola]|uniref:Flagellar protein FlgN n=1 Tax=Microvirga terricola TaxID=2719797 RepID=A0ABX0VHJ7_9HYPH|nr:flagellar protein FlgN [Microvirga terricola]NIX78405.1 flagellar protein FlgN [Microvirga terricola]
MIIQSIERLEEIIEAETVALLSRGPMDQEDFNRRKSQSLLELSRLARTVEGTTLDESTAARLAQLRTKLERNHSAIGMHLRAVREVAEIIASAIKNAESDGTYSANAYA